MKAFQFARRVPGKSAIAILWWDLGRVFTETMMRLIYGMRIVGRENVPTTGGVLVVSNHQSFFDPIINGCAICDRQFTAIARDGIFRFKPFAWLLFSYGAIAISRDGAEASAFKLALHELAEGRCVIIYPEGTRSADGRCKAFARGVLLLQRRAKIDVLPMGIDGAIDAWPRKSKVPRLRGRIEVRIGAVIPAAEFAKRSADESLALLEERVDALRVEARASIRERTQGRWPSQYLDPAPAAPAAPGAAR